MAGVGQVVGQFHLVAQAPVARGEIVALDGINGAVVQVIVCGFLCPYSFKIPVAEAVVQRQLTLSRVPFAVHRVIAVAGSQCLGERGS